MEKETSLLNLKGFAEICRKLKISEVDMLKLNGIKRLQTINTHLEDGSLSFITSSNILKEVKIQNEITLLVPSKQAFNFRFNTISVENPSFVFWSLYEFKERGTLFYKRTEINEKSKISERAFISPVGVTIEEDVKICENVVIKPGVVIKKGANIGPGTVIGSNGLEVKETIYGRIVLTHNGGVIIGENVEIGALVSVNQGFGNKPTTISADTKIDSGVHIAHSSYIGPRNIITANVTIGGSVETGSDVFFGLNSTIKNGVVIADSCYIGASSFVSESCTHPIKLIPRPSMRLPIN